MGICPVAGIPGNLEIKSAVISSICLFLPGAPSFFFRCSLVSQNQLGKLANSPILSLISDRSHFLKSAEIYIDVILSILKDENKNGYSF